MCSEACNSITRRTWLCSRDNSDELESSERNCMKEEELHLEMELHRYCSPVLFLSMLYFLMLEGNLSKMKMVALHFNPCRLWSMYWWCDETHAVCGLWALCLRSIWRSFRNVLKDASRASAFSQILQVCASSTWQKLIVCLHRVQTEPLFLL